MRRGVWVTCLVTNVRQAKPYHRVKLNPSRTAKFCERINGKVRLGGLSLPNAKIWTYGR